MEDSLDPRVRDVRRFNRLYAERIGGLRETAVRSPFPPSHARVLYELGHRKNAAAADLARDLGLDEGYLSRVLRSLAERGLVSRKPSASDRRRSLLSLTPRGAQAFAALNRRTDQEAAAILAGMTDGQQRRLLAAMRTIEAIVGAAPEAEPYRLRPHRPGDMGWVVQQHGALYHEEHGFDGNFEALAAEMVAGFVRRADPRERCWIAERGGENAGAVFCLRESDEVAKLRLLIVEPSARGLGIGRALVGECIGFARERGYRTLALWTDDVLHAARRIYQAAGFRLVREEPHRSFGVDLVGQSWELALR